MNATELFLKDGRSSGVFFCEKCRVVRLGKELAELCCEPRLCGCGKELVRGAAKCWDCRAKDYGNRKAARLEKAELVDAYDDCMLCDDDDGFYTDVDDYFDQVDAREDLREFLYLTKFKAVTLGCALDLLEGPTQDHYEDILDSVPDLTELDAAIQKANALFSEKKWGSFFPDYTRKIRVPVEEWTE